MSETRRNLHQFWKRKQLYGVYTQVPHDLTAVLEESAAKRETAKPTITEPLSNEEFQERRRRKRKPLGNAVKEPRNQQYAPRE
jgi:hypothetical protein